MQTNAVTQLSRSHAQDEQPSALAYWGTGFAGIGVMLVICFFAGLRF